MQWTVQLATRASAGEVTTTELVTIRRLAVVSTLAEVGLVLAEAKALLAKLQASVLCGQGAAYAAHHYPVALQFEAADRQAAAEVAAVPHKPDKAAAAEASRPVVMLDGACIRTVPRCTGPQLRGDLRQGRA